MKHATKSRDLLYNNGIYRNPLQRYRAILTMVTRATLARSPPVHRGGPGEGCTCNHRQNGDKQHARFGKYITVYGSPKLYSGSNDI